MTISNMLTIKKMKYIPTIKLIYVLTIPPKIWIPTWRIS
jgi:hypothetical protein